MAETEEVPDSDAKEEVMPDELARQGQEIEFIETKLEQQDEDIDEAFDDRIENTKKIADLQRKLNDTINRMDSLQENVSTIQQSQQTQDSFEAITQLDIDDFIPFVDSNISIKDPDFVIKAYKSFVKKSDKKMPTIYDEYRSIRLFKENVEKERIMDTRRNFLYNLIYHKYEYDMNEIKTANIFMNYYLEPEENSLIRQTFIAGVQLMFIIGLGYYVYTYWEETKEGFSDAGTVGYSIVIMYLTCFLILPSLEDIVSDTKIIDTYFKINVYNIVLNTLSNIVIAFVVPFITFLVIMQSETELDIVLNATAIAFIIDLDDESTSEIDMDQWFDHKTRYLAKSFQTVVPFNSKVLDDDVSNNQIRVCVAEIIELIKEENAEIKGDSFIDELQLNLLNLLKLAVIPIYTLLYPLYIIIHMIMNKLKKDRQIREEIELQNLLKQRKESSNIDMGSSKRDPDAGTSKEKLLSERKTSYHNEDSRELTPLSPAQVDNIKQIQPLRLSMDNEKDINYVGIISLNKEGNDAMYSDDLITARIKYHQAIELFKSKTELKGLKSYYKMKGMLHYNRGFAFKRLADKSSLSELISNENGRLRDNYKRAKKDLLRALQIFLPVNTDDRLLSVRKNIEEMNFNEDFKEEINIYTGSNHKKEEIELKGQLLILLGDVFCGLYEYKESKDCYEYASHVDRSIRIDKHQLYKIEKILQKMEKENKMVSDQYHSSIHFDFGVDYFRDGKFEMAVDQINNAIKFHSHESKDCLCARYYFFRSEIYDFWSLQSSSEDLAKYVIKHVKNAFINLSKHKIFKKFKENCNELLKEIKETDEYKNKQNENEKKQFINDCKLRLAFLQDENINIKQHLKKWISIIESNEYKNSKQKGRNQMMKKEYKYPKRLSALEEYLDKTFGLFFPRQMLKQKTYNFIELIIERQNDISNEKWEEFENEFIKEGYSWENIIDIDSEYFLEYIQQRIKKFMKPGQGVRRWKLSESFFNNLEKIQKEIIKIDTDDDPNNDTLQKQRHLNAIRDAKKAFEIDKSFAVGFYWVKVNEKELKKELKLAVDKYTELIEFDPKEDNKYFLRSILQNKLSNYTDAVFDLKRACELDPRNAFFHLVLGAISYNVEEYREDAINMCKKGLDMSGLVGEKELNKMRLHIMVAFYKSCNSNANYIKKFGKKGLLTVNLKQFDNVISLLSKYEIKILGFDINNEIKEEKEEEKKELDNNKYDKYIEIFEKIGEKNTIKFENDYYITKKQFSIYADKCIQNNIISFRKIMGELIELERKKKYFNPGSMEEKNIDALFHIDCDKYISRQLAVIIRQGYRGTNNRFVNQNNGNKDDIITPNDNITKERFETFFYKLPKFLKQHWNFIEKDKATYKDINNLLEFCNIKIDKTKKKNDDDENIGNERINKPFIRLQYYLIHAYDIIDHFKINQDVVLEKIECPICKTKKLDEETKSKQNTKKIVQVEKEKKKLKGDLKRENTFIMTHLDSCNICIEKK